MYVICEQLLLKAVNFEDYSDKKPEVVKSYDDNFERKIFFT